MWINKLNSIKTVGRCYGGPFKYQEITLEGQRTLTFTSRGQTGYYTRDLSEGHPGGITIGNFDFWWVNTKGRYYD